MGWSPSRSRRSHLLCSPGNSLEVIQQGSCGNRIWRYLEMAGVRTRPFLLKLEILFVPSCYRVFHITVVHSHHYLKKQNKTIKALDHELLSTITGPDKRIEQKNHRRFERPPGRASMEFICHKFSKPFRNGFQVARCPKPQKWMLYLVRPREKWMTGVTPSRKPPPGPAACGWRASIVMQSNSDLSAGKPRSETTKEQLRNVGFSWGLVVYPLVNIQKNMERSTISNG